jgi:hypothetical protein
MSQLKQQLLRRELTVSQILREYGKKFTQITERYSDGRNGRCAVGVIMSYFGWNGRDENYAGSKLLGTLIALYGKYYCNILIEARITELKSLPYCQDKMVS